MDRFKLFLKYRFSKGFWILICGIVLLMGCTDHKTTIPFEFPDYKPRLVVLSSIGSISGGEASISWSKPLRGQLGTVPALPRLSVYLLDGGVRITEFTEDADSLGYFVIEPDQVDLKSNTPYAIEIVLEESGERILSQECYLPEKPDLKNVGVELDSINRFWYHISWTQGSAKEGVGATALYPYLLDFMGDYVEKPSLGMYYLSPEFRYTDGKALPERIGRKRFDRSIKRGGTNLAQSVDIRLAFLSSGLARFKKEVDELGYLGESVYQTVRPLYSNIIGAEGIFGLYSESSVVLGFDE